MIRTLNQADSGKRKAKSGRQRAGKTGSPKSPEIRKAGNQDVGEKAKADSRIIFHIDVNSAFLSWSAVRRLREDP
jgi:hypothetical protein